MIESIRSFLYDFVSCWVGLHFYRAYLPLLYNCIFFSVEINEEKQLGDLALKTEKRVALYVQKIKSLYSYFFSRNLASTT